MPDNKMSDDEKKEFRLISSVPFHLVGRDDFVSTKGAWESIEKWVEQHTAKRVQEAEVDIDVFRKLTNWKYHCVTCGKMHREYIEVDTYSDDEFCDCE